MKITVFYRDDHPNPSRDVLATIENDDADDARNVLFRWALQNHTGSYDHTMTHELRIEVDGVRQRYIPYGPENGGTHVPQKDPTP